MLKIAICDDVAEDLDGMERLLVKTELFKNAKLYRYDSGRGLLDAIGNGIFFDIILLDVNMPIINGIEAGKQIAVISPNTVLIFVTNYPEYAINAFDCNAYHYVLKGESYEKLYGVLSKAKARCVSRKRSYSVKTRGGATHLLLSEIKYIEYSDKHLLFHTDKGIFSERGQIGELSSKLEDFGFIQIHQGFIVNSAHVRSVQKDSVILSDGTSVMMSLKRRSMVIKSLGKCKQ